VYEDHARIENVKCKKPDEKGVENSYIVIYFYNPWNYLLNHRIVSEIQELVNDSSIEKLKISLVNQLDPYGEEVILYFEEISPPDS
jgi:hypothetical protein